MKKLISLALSMIMILSTLVALPFTANAADTAPTEVVTYSSAVSDPATYKPAGTGTKEDPYKIATADDLLWLAKAHAYGNADTDYAATTDPAAKFLNGVDGDTAAENPFKDKYIVQTADIDLGGKVMPAIGRINSDATETQVIGTWYRVFGGNYDGQGFAIKNGYVAHVNPNRTDLKLYNADNSRVGIGLFGVISGATIKNVNLKNFKVCSDDTTKMGCVGLLVGVAVGAFNDPLNHNLIENCTTDADCGMVARAAVGRTSDQAEKYYRWGGLVGTASMTTIVNCTNNASISVNHTVGYAGGIVGSLIGGAVRNCTNNGNITVTNVTTATKTKDFRCFGGIIGGVPYNANGADYNVLVDSCVNKGNITNDGAAVTCYTVGGIIGGLRKTCSVTVIVSNNANLGNIDMSEAATVGVAEGAIIGGMAVFTAELDKYPQTVDLRVINNSSVAIANLVTRKTDAEDKVIQVLRSDGEVVTKYMENDATTPALSFINLGPVNDPDSPHGETANNPEKVVEACLKMSGCTVETADVMTAKVEKSRQGAVPVAVQSYTEASGKSGAVRVLAVVNNLDAKAIGVEIIKIKDGSVAADESTTSLYTSVMIAGRKTVADEGTYFAAIVLDTSKLEGEYNIKTYTVDADGNKLYRDAVESVEFKRGNLK